MSNDHSKIWKSRKSSLGKKESQLQGELESVSSAFEGQAKRILIGVAIVGIAAFAIGMAIKSSKKDKQESKSKKKNKPEKVIAKTSPSVKNVLIEKIITTVLSLLLSQLGHFLKSSKSEAKKD
ncbi:MAG: hypothetical protein KI791_02025 [Cyclobacteriaceae bacterium]|nr:hypothetical protein [Cyclobacteriaceae bacterium SS2]